MPIPTLSTLSAELAGLARAWGERVACIQAGPGRTASGIHWREGLVVAPEEAIERDDGIRVTVASGTGAAAELVGRDPSSGIALLRAPDAGAPEPRPPAGPVEVGSLALVVGRADGSLLAGLGVVAEAGPAWRSMRGGLIDRRLRLGIDLDARAEGGAAVDPAGALIGMVLFGPRRRALVIPAETIERVATTLADMGYIARGYLGVALHPLGEADGPGAIVTSLDEGGPARAAGVLLGDIVRTWQGEPITEPRDLARRLGPDSVGTRVALGCVRAGQPLTLEITVGARRHG